MRKPVFGFEIEYIEYMNIERNAQGIWQSKGCGCLIRRDYCEVCLDCLDKKLEMAGRSDIAQLHPIVRWDYHMPWVLRIRACGRMVFYGFHNYGDMFAADGAARKLHEECERFQPRREHFVVAQWALHGGEVRAYADVTRRILSQSAPEIAKRIPRYGLSAKQVRLRLAHVRPAIVCLRSALERGLILPDTPKDRREFYRASWGKWVTRRVLAEGKQTIVQASQPK